MSDPTSAKAYERGATVFSQGEPGHVAYFIRKGSVAIFSECDGVRTRIAMRGPGAIIGEMALASDARRSATAVVETDCVLFQIHKLEIERLLKEADPILRLILLTAFERLREQAARVDYFIPRRT